MGVVKCFELSSSELPFSLCKYVQGLTLSDMFVLALCFLHVVYLLLSSLVKLLYDRKREEEVVRGG